MTTKKKVKKQKRKNIGSFLEAETLHHHYSENENDDQFTTELAASMATQMQAKQPENDTENEDEVNYLEGIKNAEQSDDETRTQLKELSGDDETENEDEQNDLEGTKNAAQSDDEHFENESVMSDVSEDSNDVKYVQASSSKVVEKKQKLTAFEAVKANVPTLTRRRSVNRGIKKAVATTAATAAIDVPPKRQKLTDESVSQRAVGNIWAKRPSKKGDQYLIQWIGQEECTWEFGSKLNCPEKLEAFESADRKAKKKGKAVEPESAVPTTFKATMELRKTRQSTTSKQISSSASKVASEAVKANVPTLTPRRSVNKGIKMATTAAIDVPTKKQKLTDESVSQRAVGNIWAKRPSKEGDQYLIQWIGQEECTWEFGSKLNCPEKLEAFESADRKAKKKGKAVEPESAEEVTKQTRRKAASKQSVAKIYGKSRNNTAKLISGMSAEEVRKDFANQRIIPCKSMKGKRGSEIYVQIRKLKYKKPKFPEQIIRNHFFCSKCGTLLHVNTQSSHNTLKRHYILCGDEQKVKIKINKGHLRQILIGVMQITTDGGNINLETAEIPDEFDDAKTEKFLEYLKTHKEDVEDNNGGDGEEDSESSTSESDNDEEDKVNES